MLAGPEEGHVTPLAANHRQQLLAEAPPTHTVQGEVDGRVDDDSQFGHGEGLVDDLLVELQDMTARYVHNLKQTNKQKQKPNTTTATNTARMLAMVRNVLINIYSWGRRDLHCVPYQKSCCLSMSYVSVQLTEN